MLEVTPEDIEECDRSRDRASRSPRLQSEEAWRS
jgi:hypothetical protein